MDLDILPQPSSPDSTPPIVSQQSSTVQPSQSKNNIWLWIVAGVSLLGAGVVAGVLGYNYFNTPNVTDYDECVKAKGSVIQKSYPATCVTKNGQRFVQTLTDEEKKQIQSPSLTPNPIANWRSIQRNNWQFKVPSLWHYWECNSDLIFVGPKIDKDKTYECAFDGSPGILQVSRSRGDNDRSIPTNTNPAIDPYVSNKKTILVDGKPATEQQESISEGQGQGTRLYVYVDQPDFFDYIILHDIKEKQTFDQILATFQFEDNTPKRVSLTVTPRQSVVPQGWKIHEFLTLGLTVFAPDDWRSNAQNFSGSSSTLVKFWKASSPDIIPIQLEIKSDWSNTGDTKYYAKNYTVAGSIPAIRIDPPKKDEKQQERYQTNVFFEYRGKVYVFQCVHNWTQDYLDTCNTMLSTMKFQ